MSNFEGRELHFIAIGGAGMSALALACAALGAKVSGSDQSRSSYIERLRGAGLEPRIGHDPEAVPAAAEVVVSTAIGDDNPELRRARERGQSVLHRSELMAELTATGRLIAVAGAHGKTTTSGMIAHALRTSGAKPSFLLGGELPGAGPGGEPANADWNAGGLIVAEADESDGSFLRLRPEVAAITNVELDHHSHWSGEADLHRAFGEFRDSSDRAVVPAGAALDHLAREGDLRFAVEGPSTSSPSVADLLAREIEPTAGGNRFTLDHPRGEPLEVLLGVPGRHNVANATCAIAALLAAGVGMESGPGLPSLDEVAAALASFPGMARRQERKGLASGAIVYDDYAHHPTEVEAALRAMRELPHRRLIVIFQPHLYSRTKALASRFGRALALADEVGVLDVYAARERPEGELAGISGRLVAEATAAAAPGVRVMWLGDAETAVEVVGAELGEGDLVVTVGAGDVHRVGEELIECSR